MEPPTEIRNHLGERLDLAWSPGRPGDPRVVVIGHGVTANKDRTWAVRLAAELADAGLASLRFSFSGNGESEGDFRASCPSKEVHDLGAVLDALHGARLAYAGHSMGAAVGVLRAAGDERIERLVSLAGMVHTAAFAERKFGDLVPGRDTMWDKPECPLSDDFLADMRAIDTVAPLADQVSVPWLLVHGTDDTVVPLEESRHIAARAGAELSVLEGADHVFDGGAADEMARRVVGWLAAFRPLPALCERRRPRRPTEGSPVGPSPAKRRQEPDRGTSHLSCMNSPG
jgi:pimeloyl-ACP methyl ester carboxylesterase